jgi:hypothetical protein
LTDGQAGVARKQFKAFKPFKSFKTRRRTAEIFANLKSEFFKYIVKAWLFHKLHDRRFFFTGRAGATESRVTASQRALRFEFRYGVPVVSKFLKDGFIVGTEQGRRRDRLRVSTGEAESCAQDGYLAIGARRGLKVLDEASLCDLRMFKDLGDG